MKRYDVCIIGGGAAGLAAAASLDTGMTICLLEKNKVPGRKIMATGGGRCNITNKACKAGDKTLDFFRSMGMELYCDEEGRYFPYSNQASDVAKLLTDAAVSNGVDIMTERRVIGLDFSGEHFEISCENGDTVYADNVIMAPGGKAAPQFGTTGDGYALAKELGHSIKRLYPVLTAVECGDFKEIKGVRARGNAALYKDGKLVAEESGEIQFTEDGLSGICIFNLTPFIRAEEGETFSEALRRFEIVLDLAVDFTCEEINERTSSFGILSYKLAKRVPPEKIKSWNLPVIGVKGWRQAQCTAGDICLDEIDMDTMESEMVPGLFFAGEIIDYQGPCGGYNLQNAWETAIKSAEALNGRFKRKK